MLNKKILIPVISTLAVLLVALGLFFGYKAWINSRIESGEKQITIEVVVETNDAEYTNTYKFWTNQNFLGEALDESVDIETINDPMYGRYIVSVDGYEQNPDNGLYWSIYINGELGMSGMDVQNISHEDVIKLELKPFTME